MVDAKYHRDWYYRNKDKVLPRKKARVEKQNRFLRHVRDEIKLFLGCELCGYDKHPRALDFHHRERSEKIFEISTATGTGMSVKTLLSEISKCGVLCANCHRIQTHNERVLIGKSDNGSLRALEA
jgi:hypothetical protein